MVKIEANTLNELCTKLDALNWKYTIGEGGDEGEEVIDFNTGKVDGISYHVELNLEGKPYSLYLNKMVKENWGNDVIVTKIGDYVSLSRLFSRVKMVDKETLEDIES